MALRILCSLLLAAAFASPASVDITWMSISNMYYEVGGKRILTDGYFTRIPQSEFFGGGGGLARTRSPRTPDVAAVTRVMNALGGTKSIDLLLTGHSHFDHSFDTATWSRLTGARIVGSRTTCLQAEAQKIPRSRCRAVEGGEKIPVAPGVTMYVVRMNHSGDSRVNPEQHDPVELKTVPRPDPDTGGLRAGVAEDFPNGGGNRGYLFVASGQDGSRLSWFFQNSASPVDLAEPLENLKKAMNAARLDSVDLWIGPGSAAVARMELPILKPRAYLPVHWDGLYGAFEAGVPKPYSDPAMEALLKESGVRLVRPSQYMDKWRLDAAGVRELDNSAVQRALGFAKP